MVLIPDLHQLQKAQHDQCEHGSQNGDLPETESYRQAYGAGQPHARACGQSMNFPLGKEDQSRSQKCYAGSRGFD